MTSRTAGCWHQKCRCLKSYLFCSLIFLWRKLSIHKVHLSLHALNRNKHTHTHKTHQNSISCWPSMACSGGCKMLQTNIKSPCPPHPSTHSRHAYTALRHSEKHHVCPSFLCLMVPNHIRPANNSWNDSKGNTLKAGTTRSAPWLDMKYHQSLFNLTYQSQMSIQPS